MYHISGPKIAPTVSPEIQSIRCLLFKQNDILALGRTL